MPQVSFIVPCFNQWEYLPAALDSIKAQTLKNVPLCEKTYEIILVCETEANLPCDHEWMIPEVDKIVWIKENVGLAKARNAGVAVAEGTYIVPLDADDTIEPTFLARTLAATRVGLFSPDVFGVVTVNGAAKLGPAILEGNYLPYCALYPRHVLDVLHGWQQPHPTIQGMEDWDLWIRMYRAGYTTIPVNETLFNWNRHPGSMSAKFEGNELFGEIRDAMMRRIFGKETP